MNYLNDIGLWRLHPVVCIDIVSIQMDAEGCMKQKHKYNSNVKYMVFGIWVNIIIGYERN